MGGIVSSASSPALLTSNINNNTNNSNNNININSSNNNLNIASATLSGINSIATNLSSKISAKFSSKSSSKSLKASIQYYHSSKKYRSIGGNSRDEKDLEDGEIKHLDLFVIPDDICAHASGVTINRNLVALCLSSWDCIKHSLDCGPFKDSVNGGFTFSTIFFEQLKKFDGVFERFNPGVNSKTPNKTVLFLKIVNYILSVPNDSFGVKSKIRAMGRSHLRRGIGENQFKAFNQAFMLSLLISFENSESMSFIEEFQAWAALLQFMCEQLTFDKIVFVSHNFSNINASDSDLLKLRGGSKSLTLSADSGDDAELAHGPMISCHHHVTEASESFALPNVNYLATSNSMDLGLNTVEEESNDKSLSIPRTQKTAKSDIVNSVEGGRLVVTANGTNADGEMMNNVMVSSWRKLSPFLTSPVSRVSTHRPTSDVSQIVLAALTNDANPGSSPRSTARSRRSQREIESKALDKISTSDYSLSDRRDSFKRKSLSMGDMQQKVLQLLGTGRLEPTLGSIEDGVRADTGRRGSTRTSPRLNTGAESSKSNSSAASSTMLSARMVNRELLRLHNHTMPGGVPLKFSARSDPGDAAQGEMAHTTDTIGRVMNSLLYPTLS